MGRTAKLEAWARKEQHLAKMRQDGIGEVAVPSKVRDKHGRPLREYRSIKHFEDRSWKTFQSIVRGGSYGCVARCLK